MFRASALLSLLVAASCDDGGSGGDKAVPDAAADINQRDDGSAVGADTIVEAGSDQRLAAPASFIVEGTLTRGPERQPISGAPFVERHDFTLRLDPVAGELVVGAAGTAARAPVSSADGVTFTATGPFQLPLLAPQTCSATVTYSNFTMTVTPQGLVGHAEARLMLIVGDVGWQPTATLAMRGRPDDLGPALVELPGAVDPLAGMFLRSSEPCQPSPPPRSCRSLARLELTPFGPRDSGVVAGFHKPELVALRYATSYEVMIAPWTDLAGIAGRARPSLQTFPAPPLVAEDGFEQTSGSQIGGAAVIEADKLPPIAGTRSVLVWDRAGVVGPSPSRRFTVRLAVAAGDTRVGLQLRPIGLGEGSGGSYGNSLRVAVPGGAIVAAQLPASEILTTRHPASTPTGEIWLGSTRTLELQLPPDAAGEVVFDVTTGVPATACGAFPPTAGYLIDDLRVE